MYVLVYVCLIGKGKGGKRGEKGGEGRKKGKEE